MPRTDHENNPDQGVIPSTSESTNTFDPENAFQEPGNDTVKLTFPDRKVLHVSKAFLEICSRKFEQIFGPMSTESDTERVEIAVKHQYEPFLYMLKFLHPRIQKQLDDVDDKIVADIFDIANEYQIRTAVDASKDLLLAQLNKLVADNFTVLVSSLGLLNKALPIVSLAEKWNNDAIMEKSIERVSTVPYVNIVNSDEYKQLKEATKIRILISRLKKTDTENRVFK